MIRRQSRMGCLPSCFGRSVIGILSVREASPLTLTVLWLCLLSSESTALEKGQLRRKCTFRHFHIHWQRTFWQNNSRQKEKTWVGLPRLAEGKELPILFSPPLSLGQAPTVRSQLSDFSADESYLQGCLKSCRPDPPPGSDPAGLWVHCENFQVD